MNRRQIVKSGTLGFLGAASSGLWVYRNAHAAQESGRLVVIMLRGAVDGLSVVAPYGESNYYAQRPNIAIAKPGEPDGLLALDNFFGLHPALVSLMPYWERKQLGFVHASGSPDPTRSHFDAQDFMESGTPGKKTTPDGWLNRLARVIAPSADELQRLQSVNLGPVIPRIFSGIAPIASLAQGNAAITRGVLDREPVAAAFARLYAGDDSLSRTVREATATRKEIIASLQSVASDDASADKGALSLRGLSADTARLGSLIRSDSRVRIAFVPVGGWDTHVNQGNGKGQLANRLQLLAEAIDSLIKSMGDRFSQTSIVVMSEFGRTVKQNGNQGTDHGHGNVIWTLGAGASFNKGGVVGGRWPGLDTASLHEGRDLKLTTDFRHVIADILQRRMNISDKQLDSVFPNWNNA
jgi:uncharacterized protein (DUF1501 family)